MNHGAWQWHKKKMIWSRRAGNGNHIAIAVAGYAHQKSKGVWGHAPLRFLHLLRVILVHSERKICDLLCDRKSYHYTCTYETWPKIFKFYYDNGQLAFYKCSRELLYILVSAYRHQQRVDTPTAHYYCILHTCALSLASYIKQTHQLKSKMVPSSSHTLSTVHIQ